MYAELNITSIIISCRYYKYEQKLSSLFWKIDYKDIVIEDIDSAEADLKTKVRHILHFLHFIVL